MEEQQVVVNKDTWVQKSKKLYTNNFPTDKQTCSLMLTHISMVLSGLNFIILANYIDYDVDSLRGFGVNFAFTVIMCGVNYLFYQGFFSDDHKQISLWFVVKSVEIMESASIFLSILISYGRKGWRYTQHHLHYVIPYLLFIVLNFLLVLYMLQKVKQMKKNNYNNIYLLSEHTEPSTLKEKEEKKNTNEEQPVVGNNTWVKKLKKFFINNFPADNQTHNLTLISMVLSGLNFIVLTRNTPYVQNSPGCGVLFVFCVTMCYVNYLFYQGFLSNDHKHISPWFVVKSAEIAGIALVILFCEGWWEIRHHLRFALIYPALIALDFLLLLYVAYKVKQMKKKSLVSEHMEPLTSKEKEEKKTKIPQ